MAGKTKETIVSLALTLIQQKGFSSFSYDDIARQLGITKAAIHYHFEGKEDLGIAVCERIEEMMQNCYDRNVDAVRNHIGTPWRFIEDVLETIGTDENCPVSSLQSDYECLSERFRERIAQVSRWQIDLFVKLVKEYSPSVDDERVVQFFFSIKGLLQYRRIFGEEYFQKNIQSIRSQFELMLGNE